MASIRLKHGVNQRLRRLQASTELFRLHAALQEASISRTSINDATVLLSGNRQPGWNSRRPAFSRGQQRDVHQAARPAQQAEEHHVEQHYRQDTYQTVARVIAKANGLVIERRERIGDIQPPTGWRRSSSRGLIRGRWRPSPRCREYRAGRRSGSCLPPPRCQIYCPSPPMAPVAISPSPLLASMGLARTLRLKVSFSPCHVSSTAARFFAETEGLRIEFLILDIFGGIEGVQRTHYHFFRHRAGKQADGGLPVIFMHADRFKHRRNDPAHRGQRGVVDVVDDPYRSVRNCSAH